MEDALFGSEDWAVLDTTHLVFYDVELVRQIGDYPVGTKFESASINYSTGELELWPDNDENNKISVRLKLEVIP